MTDRVRDLEQSVAKLDEVEFKQFAKWFANHQDRVWQSQFVRDAKAGRLDFLADEAHAERGSGGLRDL